MRKTIRDLTSVLRSHLESYEELENNEDTIIHVELMAVGCQLIDENLPLEDCWVTLTGYDDLVIPKLKDSSVLFRLRILFKKRFGKTLWANMLEEYFKVSRKHRLLDKDDEGDLYFITPRFDPNRKAFYEEILKNPIPLKVNQQKFIESGEFTYAKKQQGYLVSKKGIIPKDWSKKTDTLPYYREKKDIRIEMPLNLQGIAKKMDEELSSDSKVWQERVGPISLRSVKGNHQFAFKHTQHIGGGLASGKSTFRTVSTYWLVKEKSARVGFIEESVPQALERANELRQLGLKVVTLVGRSNRKKHQKDYLLANPFESFAELSTSQSLTSLSDICLIKTLANDTDDEVITRYPCTALTKRNEKERRKCSLAHLCGIYKEWAALEEADVWITTSAAVLHTKLPAVIDPFERVIYKAMYDLLDVIYVDEADQIQSQFDNAFIRELFAFGNSTHFIESITRELDAALGDNYHYADHEMLMEMRKTSAHASDVVWKLFEKVKKSKTFRDTIENRMLYLNYLISEIAEQLAEDETLKDEIASTMRRFVKSATYSSVSFGEDPLHALIHTIKPVDKVGIIIHWIKQKGIEIPSKIDGTKLYAKIELFVYLAHIENAMHIMIQMYPFIQENLQNKIDVPFLNNQGSFDPFMREAMTGVMLGYWYERPDGKNLGTFKMIQYMSVGRDLLEQWSTLYEASDCKEGPALILLSGTSYAPNSHHYHIAKEPDWFIESSRQQSQLEQHALVLRDAKNEEEPIIVSGVSSQFKRDQNLKKLTKELEQHIERELAHWKELGEQRRVLLVVNSYEDVEVVGAVLEEMDRYQNNYRLLSQKNRSDIRWFPRSRLEQFSHEEEEILVVPLLAASRGHNIIDKESKGALFGTAYFLVRPYPIPKDLSYFVQTLHGNLSIFLQNITAQQLEYGKAMTKLRSKSRFLFNQMYQKPSFWSLLTEEQRIVLAWYTFIPTWQLIGRLLRGGKDARVFYCDAKYHQPTQDETSLIEYWQKIMHHHHPLFTSLYGPFQTSILEIKQKEVFE